MVAAKSNVEALWGQAFVVTCPGVKDSGYIQCACGIPPERYSVAYVAYLMYNGWIYYYVMS